MVPVVYRGNMRQLRLIRGRPRKPRTIRDEEKRLAKIVNEAIAAGDDPEARLLEDRGYSYDAAVGEWYR